MCDRMGLLLWHDLMFACSLYPADQAFLENVREEVKYQLRRITGHPCILIYTYNNENEELIYNDWLKVGANKERFFIDYVHLVCDTIHPVVSQEDPVTPTMPSSPSNGHNKWGNPAAPNMGDIHYWGVWHGNKPFTAFNEIKPRFCSEFGFQSFSSFSAWKDLDPEEMQVNSPSVEFKQRSPLAGTKCIVEHMMRYFRFPNNFANFIYLSQVVQALAIKTAVEHWRRLKPYCSGVLYWQLNDIWPAISWSSVEHNGQWKLLHHFAKQFYADVLLSATEPTPTSASSSVPLSQSPSALRERRVEFWVTNDLLAALPKCILRVDLVNIIAKSVTQVATSRVDVAAQSSACLHSVSFSDLIAQLPSTVSNKVRTLEDNCFLTMSLLDPQGHKLSSNIYFFAPPKKFSLPPCPLAVQVTSVESGKFTIAVSAPVLALFVHLEYGDMILAAGHFSDNGFALLPKEERQVTFAFDPALPGPKTKEDVLARLKFKSLRDSY